MKSAVWIFFLIISIGLFSGCGDKKAGIEGKLVDGKGQPMAGVKIIAKQMQPIKGYEQFEVATGPDGAFILKGLFPSSEYSVFPSSDKWETAVKVTVKSGPEGQTSMLPSPMTIRFTLSKDGVVSDSRLGLQWVPAPDRSLNPIEGEAYSRTLSLAGGGWRLPTKAELKSVYDASMKGGADPIFNIRKNWVWTVDGAPWGIDFSNGHEGIDWGGSVGGNNGFRVLAVRSPK